MLPSATRKASATLPIKLSVLNVPGHTHRYRRFAPTLTGDHARLAEICAWFQLHNTGLSTRYILAVSLAHIAVAPGFPRGPRTDPDVRANASGSSLGSRCRA